MPIYEYSCTSCGSEWEEIQRITEDPITVCPECGQPKAHRLISQTSFILKGSGWYVTDYGRGSGGASGEKPKKSDESSKDSSSDSSTKTSKKSDSKD